MRSESVAEMAKGRSWPGNEASPMIRPVAGICFAGASRRARWRSTGKSAVEPVGHPDRSTTSLTLSRRGKRHGTRASATRRGVP